MWIIAHRGASGAAPENTLAAFRKAVELGAEFIETDLQLTRDARLVALHDDTLDRTTNGHGPVAAKTLEEVRGLDAGAWFLNGSKPGGDPGSFAGEHVPTIEEVLAFGRDKDIGLYLELKPLGPSGAEHAMVGALQTAGEIGRSVVLSFDPSALRLLRRHQPLLVTGYLYDEKLPDAVSRTVDAGARQILPRADHVDTALVKEAHRRDLKVVVWTVNDAGEMREMRRLGVDGIITNFPDRLVDMVKRG